MTLPTNTPIKGTDDDSDMFGPPRSSHVGHHHQRSRVPMISPKLRLREERKRILQLCAHKLERIKDSEANLRRSVCINNTYSRLTDELRREKQSRYLANLPKSETKPETAHDNILFSSYENAQCNGGINCNSSDHRNDPFTFNSHHHHRPNNVSHIPTPLPINQPSISTADHGSSSLSMSSTISEKSRSKSSSSSSTSSSSSSSSCNVDADLEILDRELSAINASMPLIDPEITQGAEQLEKAVSSRKRSRSEDENDRLVREALSQFYLPTQRLISAIDDCPLDIKRSKMVNQNNCSNNHNHNNNNNNNINNINMNGCYGGGSSSTGDLDLDLGLDLNQSQKDFEVIMDALRLGTSSPTPNDSCGQAAMISESGVFHNLVVTSLET